jgi:hypothetical protein
MKSTIYWDITPCSLLNVNRRFGGTNRLHLQGGKISRARNQRESRWQVEQSASGTFGFYRNQEGSGRVELTSLLITLWGHAQRTEPAIIVYQKTLSYPVSKWLSSLSEDDALRDTHATLRIKYLKPARVVVSRVYDTRIPVINWDHRTNIPKNLCIFNLSYWSYIRPKEGSGALCYSTITVSRLLLFEKSRLFWTLNYRIKEVSLQEYFQSPSKKPPLPYFIYSSFPSHLIGSLTDFSPDISGLIEEEEILNSSTESVFIHNLCRTHFLQLEGSTG